MDKQKHRNITLSLPQEMITDLHIYVKKRGISRFVEEAILDRLKSEKLSLEQQYREAALDEERNKTFEDWDGMVGDGLNEKNDW